MFMVVNNHFVDFKGEGKEDKQYEEEKGKQNRRKLSCHSFFMNAASGLPEMVLMLHHTEINKTCNSRRSVMLLD